MHTYLLYRFDLDLCFNIYDDVDDDETRLFKAPKNNKKKTTKYYK
jgi:hypothetical protein